MPSVRALKTREDAERVKNLLDQHFGHIYAQVWAFCINTGLRISDALSLKMEQAIEGLDLGVIEIVEAKTKKKNRLGLNVVCKQVINERLKDHPEDVWLFQSHPKNFPNRQKPLTRQSVHRAMRSVGKMLKTTLGSHSARKTRARLMYEDNASIALIMSMLNHSSERQTMVYIDVVEEERQKSYHDFVL